MSTTNTDKIEVLLLGRSNDWYNHISAEELQAAMTKFQNWCQSLQAKGIIKGGAPLQRTGKIFSGKGKIVDGPFTESKEAIGGYFLLSVDSFEEAVAIAKSAPMLDYDITLELRPLAEECPSMARVRAICSEEQLASLSGSHLAGASA